MENIRVNKDLMKLLHVPLLHRPREAIVIKGSMSESRRQIA